MSVGNWKRTGTTFALLVLLLGAATSGMALEKRGSVAAKPADQTPQKRWGRVLWRSALVPGWGQWKNGDGWKGLGVLGAFALNAMWWNLQGQAESNSYKEYLRAKSPSDAQKAWDNNRTQSTLYVTSQVTLGALYVGQIAEAVYHAPYDPAPKPLAEQRPVLLAFDWEF